MVLDGAGTEEQPGADLGIRQAVAGQPRDLGLLHGQLIIAGGTLGLGAVSAPGIYVPKKQQ